MHFSTPVLLSSLFSLSLALPQLPQPKGQPTGRLLVSYYNEPTFRTFGMKSGASSSGGKGSPVLKESKPFTIKAFNSESPQIHMMDIVASYGKFFIGNMTGSTCPENVKDCPTGKVTALQTTREGRVYLVSCPCSCKHQRRDRKKLTAIIRMSSTEPKPFTSISPAGSDSIHRLSRSCVRTHKMPHSPSRKIPYPLRQHTQLSSSPVWGDPLVT